jgi:hypothetical protein
MTGFKLHCPPGFVDRAYLVFFLVANTTHRTADFDGSESLSPPIRVRVRNPALRPDTSPWVRRHPVQNDACGVPRGGQIGRSQLWQRRCAIAVSTARCSGPVPPEEPAPTDSRATPAHSPYPVAGRSRARAIVQPVSRRGRDADASGMPAASSTRASGDAPSARDCGAGGVSPAWVTAKPLHPHRETHVPQASGGSVTRQ